uniref:Uncharacterized protein n=1 Tax=Rhizophora mucronata TaxID=61149 RepID=A0A2P2NT96_RHIMU
MADQLWIQDKDRKYLSCLVSIYNLHARLSTHATEVGLPLQI